MFDDPDLTIHDAMTADDIAEWDSFMHINLMFSIEQAFRVQFSDDQLTAFADVGELESFLVRHARA